jgi:hypothetical protein
MSKFLTELKKFMMEDDEFLSSNTNPVGYYNIIFENKDKLIDIIEECDNHYLDFRYNHDVSEGYTNGSIDIHLYRKSLSESYGWQSGLNHYYTINLNEDDRMWGYCQCSPSDEGYNPITKCCGMGCDWTAPQLSISKIESKGTFGFSGQEKDLWEMEFKWGSDSKENEEENKRKEKESQVKYIEEEIQELLKRKEVLLNQE